MKQKLNKLYNQIRDYYNSIFCNRVNKEALEKADWRPIPFSNGFGCKLETAFRLRSGDNDIIVSRNRTLINREIVDEGRNSKVLYRSLNAIRIKRLKDEKRELNEKRTEKFSILSKFFNKL